MGIAKGLEFLHGFKENRLQRNTERGADEVGQIVHGDIKCVRVFNE